MGYVIAWFVLSVPFGIALGKFIKWRRECDEQRIEKEDRIILEQYGMPLEIRSIEWVMAQP